ncbi:MAG: MATE family efflux transporter [Candidatus Omnitrophica bacterium]|nr:MATE family efflux transporter [Candidatus Omnitrophota bacterium]MDD5501736.1 MATE family efflux transporter [Candidatus Omnitrophota bacterium]
MDKRMVKPVLVRDGVLKTVLRMAVPMLAGTFALNAYNLTDTWFVSRLGTNALAAMSFTFPVVMLLGFIMRGLGTGVMTVVAHALGRSKQKTAARITTHAVFLSTSISIVLTVIGMLTVDPLFVRLGATGEVLTLTRQYMMIWYFGLAIWILEIMFNDIIIGTGNTKAVSSLMVGGTVLNFILDPVMIFGLLGFPRMGIKGAALATVISQTLVLGAAFYFVHKKYGLILFVSHSRMRIISSWRRILRIGIPATLSSVLTPLSAAVVIKIVSGFGHEAVAAIGVASRIETFAFMVPMTVGMSLVPFIAQNYGAGRFDRIESVRKGTMLFALCFGFVAAGIFIFISRPLGRLFSSDPGVIDILVQYIYVTCFGYGFLEVHRYAGFCMIGVHRPASSALLNTIRVVVMMIPLAYLGSRLFGLRGVFWGRLVTDVFSAAIGVIWSGRIIGIVAKGSRPGAKSA